MNVWAYQLAQVIHRNKLSPLVPLLFQLRGMKDVVFAIGYLEEMAQELRHKLRFTIPVL